MREVAKRGGIDSPLAVHGIAVTAACCWSPPVTDPYARAIARRRPAQPEPHPACTTLSPGGPHELSGKAAGRAAPSSRSPSPPTRGPKHHFGVPGSRCRRWRTERFVSANGGSAPGEPLGAAGSVLAGGPFKPE